MHVVEGLQDDAPKSHKCYENIFSINLDFLLSIMLPPSCLAKLGVEEKN
jgi:hypothetical protein